MIEQLCIKKLHLKEPECIKCRGYDLTCLDFEEVTDNSRHNMMEKGHYESDAPMNQTEPVKSDKGVGIDSADALRGLDEYDNPLEEEHYLEQNEYTMEEL